MSERVPYFERVGRKINEIRERCGVEIEKLSSDSGLSANAHKLIEISANNRDFYAFPLNIQNKNL